LELVLELELEFWSWDKRSGLSERGWRVSGGVREGKGGGETFTI